jgi:hypothetical protein
MLQLVTCTHIIHLTRRTDEFRRPLRFVPIHLTGASPSREPRLDSSKPRERERLRPNSLSTNPFTPPSAPRLRLLRLSRPNLPRELASNFLPFVLLTVVLVSPAPAFAILSRRSVAPVGVHGVPDDGHF